MNIITKLFYRSGISKEHKLMFFGSGRVAFPSLKVLAENYPNLTVVTVSSQEQKKSFNGIESFCINNNLNWGSPITSKNDKQKRKQQWTTFISQMPKVDFGVVCSYGFMLPSRFINLFSKGLIVVHPSLLPMYRGGAPIFHAIANGDNKSGVSYVEISKGKFDEGNLLHQVEVQISKIAVYKQIEEQLAQLAANNLLQVLQKIDDLRPGKPQNQMAQSIPKELQAAPLVLSSHLLLNRKAQDVYNWSRALEIPKVWFQAKQKDIIVKFNPEYLQGEGEVGTFKVVGKRLFLRCLDKYIQVRTWYESGRMEQPPGIFIAQFIKSGKYPLEKVRVN